MPRSDRPKPASGPTLIGWEGGAAPNNYSNQHCIFMEQSLLVALAVGDRITRNLAAVTGVSILVEVVGVARDRGAGVYGRAGVALCVGYMVASCHTSS